MNPNLKSKNLSQLQLEGRVTTPRRVLQKCNIAGFEVAMSQMMCADPRSQKSEETNSVAPPEHKQTNKQHSLND